MDEAGAQEEAGDEEGDGDGEQQDTAKVSPVRHRISPFLDRQTLNFVDTLQGLRPVMQNQKTSLINIFVIKFCPSRLSRKNLIALFMKEQPV